MKIYYYVYTRKGNLGDDSDDPIIPFRELEERYQFRLWLNEQASRTGKRPSTKFADWRCKNGCVTFYDYISRDETDVSVG